MIFNQRFDLRPAVPCQQSTRDLCSTQIRFVCAKRCRRCQDGDSRSPVVPVCSFADTQPACVGSEPCPTGRRVAFSLCGSPRRTISGARWSAARGELTRPTANCSRPRGDLAPPSRSQPRMYIHRPGCATTIGYHMPHQKKYPAAPPGGTVTGWEEFRVPVRQDREGWKVMGVKSYSTTSGTGLTKMPGRQRSDGWILRSKIVNKNTSTLGQVTSGCGEQVDNCRQCSGLPCQLCDRRLRACYWAVSGIGLWWKQLLVSGPHKRLWKKRNRSATCTPFVRLLVGVAAAVTFQSAVPFQLPEIVTELVQAIRPGRKLKRGQDGLMNLFGGSTVDRIASVQEHTSWAGRRSVADRDCGTFAQGFQPHRRDPLHSRTCACTRWPLCDGRLHRSSRPERAMPGCPIRRIAWLHG
jgi:hypothetical protein